MKQITKTLVKETAEKLIKDNSETTTLEVKNELRALGYFALQDQVSNFMQEIEEEEVEWTYIDNGTYRSYLTAQPAQTFSLNVSQPITVASKVIQTKKSKVNPPLTIKVIPDTGDWQVRAKVGHGNTQVFFYPKTYTRTQVRGDFAKVTKVHFHDVRATKVK